MSGDNLETFEYEDLIVAFNKKEHTYFFTSVTYGTALGKVEFKEEAGWILHPEPNTFLDLQDMRTIINFIQEH